jgi:TatD family-associated radical SAM protein
MTTKTDNKMVYFLNGAMYINVTNLCTNNCVFCLRNLSDTVDGSNLWLKEENISSNQIIEELKLNNYEKQKEIIFCGYGEPFIRVEIVKEVAKFIKRNYPEISIRVNTNGQANLIHKRNIVPELVGLVDKVSVSLNAENAKLYGELTQCKFDCEQAFENVKKFIIECQKHGIHTTATIVTGFKDCNVNVEACKQIAETLGVKFRIREWLEAGYS